MKKSLLGVVVVCVGIIFASGGVAEAGVMGEVAERPWGERSFYANDPFGNKICFVDRPTVFTGE